MIKSRVIQNPITTVTGLVLIILGGIGLYVKLDITLCEVVISTGLGLIISKDNWFKPTQNETKPKRYKSD